MFYQGLTWRANPQPIEESFKAMRAAIEEGNIFWNVSLRFSLPIDILWLSGP
jgi:pyridoxine 4-dehydrogenase